MLNYCARSRYDYPPPTTKIDLRLGDGRKTELRRFQTGETPMRQFIRHPSDVPIEYRITRLGFGRRERLSNISQGGLCFQAPNALQRGCVIQIKIPVREPAFETTGTIVWCRRANGHYDVGVQFADASIEFSVRMVEQICQIHHYQKEVLAKEGRSLSGPEAAAEWVAKHAQDFPS